MTRRLASVLALGAVLLAGCGRDSDGETATTPMPATLAGVYAGRLPCSNCAAIEATLWLRPDGRFFIRQRLEDDTEGATAATTKALQGPSTTYGLGRWQWDDVAAEAVLRGAGPDRRLKVRDGDHLVLRVASPVEHALARDVTEPRFEDRVTLDGESAVSENGATFTECLTGLTLPVADAGAYRELRRQHRRMNPRGKVALTTIEGHLIASGEGSTSERLVVDRFVTIKPGQGCRG
jgi:hypothetical protein